jgi:hypothetical protein
MVQPSVRTAVMAAARENRSLESRMIPSCMATCRVLDIAVGSGRRCGPARGRARHLPMGQLSHHAERGLNCSEAPNGGRALSRCGRPGPLTKLNSRR